MTPDDPRHGSTGGWAAGCRQDCCLGAKARYAKAPIHLLTTASLAGQV